MRVNKRNGKIIPQFFYKILWSISAVVIVIIIITFLVTDYYSKILENKVIESYQNSLKLITNTLADSTIWFSLDKKINSILHSDNFKRMAECANPAKEFSQGHPLLGLQEHNYLYKNILHSIFFINNKKGIVITGSGIVKINTFFSMYFPDIPKDALLKTNTEGFPMPAKYYTKSRIFYPEYVYPFFYPCPGNSSNIIMINYTENYFRTFLSSNKTSANSELFIMRHDGIVLAHSNVSKLNTVVADNNILEKIKTCRPFYTNYFGGNSLLISYKGPSTPEYIEDMKLFISGISFREQDYFIALIPNDIFNQPLDARNILILAGVIFIILALLLSFIISKILYRPINKIYSLFNPLINKTTDKSVNDLAFLETNIENLLHDRKKLALALPKINDQYLIKILNEDSEFKEDEIVAILRQEGIHFKYDFFAVVIFELYYTNKFMENYSREEQLNLITKTHSYFFDQLSRLSNAHLLKIKNNWLCLIFNAKPGTAIKDIFNIVKTMDLKKDFNNNQIDVFYGLSRINKGVRGLRESYREASTALASLSLYGQERIAGFDPDKKDEKIYFYEAEDENKLINLILSGHRDRALQFLNNIIAKNQNKKISIANMKEFYLKLYFTGKKILYKKKLPLSKKSVFEYVNMMESYKEMNVVDLSQNVFNFLLKIINASYEHIKGKLNICTVIDYINENFSNNFSLEMIADNFKISTGHLSYLLKNHWGMSYQEYINDLRIRRAKKLLVETRDTIDKISTECGFSRRHTFIRMFKKLEGITPTEYRVL